MVWRCNFSEILVPRTKISVTSQCTFLLTQTPLFFTLITNKPTNQPMHNNYVIIVYGIYWTINNINGGGRNNLHVLQLWSGLFTSSEYHINKHLSDRPLLV